MKTYLFAILSALLLLGGCARPTLSSKADEHYDFKALQTVAVVHPDIEDPRTAAAQKLFDRIIADKLKAKGYRLADRASADFIVTYHLGVTDSRHLSNDYRIIGIRPTYYSPHYGHYGYHYVVGKSTQSFETTEGKIIVEAIDPRRDNLVFWNARMTDRLKAFKSPKEQEDYFKKVVDKVFATFPNRH